MHSFYTAHFVFGVYETDPTLLLDREWMAMHFPRLRLYSSEVVHGYRVNAIYGRECKLNNEDGSWYIDDKDIDQVEELFELLYHHHEVRGWRTPRLGYFNALSGDIGTNRDVREYVPT